MKSDFKAINPVIVCRDGVTLSVQASKYHYCSPRENEGPYHQYEVGFITGSDGLMFTPPDSWRDYSDGDKFPNDVYGYVPKRLVDDFIASHGGIDAGTLP